MRSRVARRSMLAGAVSLALHGGGVLVVVLLAGTRAAPPPPPPIELTDVQIVAPPPPPLPVPGPSRSGTRAGAGTSAKAGALGRRGHEAMPHSQTRAPRIADPFADLAMSHETPTELDPGNPEGTTGLGVGTGLFGTGTGAGAGYGSLGDGPGALQVPQPPPSLARPPRPRDSYSDSKIPGAHEFASKILVLDLSIDPRGTVRGVRVLQSVADWIDTYASAIARGYKFDPALADNGEPTSGHFLWKFVITGDDGGQADYDRSIYPGPRIAPSSRIGR